MHKVLESVGFSVHDLGFSPCVNHKAPPMHIDLQLNDRGDCLPIVNSKQQQSLLVLQKGCWKCLPIAWVIKGKRVLEVLPRCLGLSRAKRCWKCLRFAWIIKGKRVLEVLPRCLG